jgi:hypothetical protein
MAANAFGTLNQADRIATGRAVINAIRHAGNRGIRRRSPISGHGVDVTDTHALGIASLKAHSQYLAGLGDDAAERTEVMLTMMARREGLPAGLHCDSHAASG